MSPLVCRLCASSALRLVGARQALPLRRRRRRRRRAFPFKQGGGVGGGLCASPPAFVGACGQPRAPDGFPLPAARCARGCVHLARRHGLHGAAARAVRAADRAARRSVGLALASPRASAAAESPLAAVLFLALSGAPMIAGPLAGAGGHFSGTAAGRAVRPLGSACGAGGEVTNHCGRCCIEARLRLWVVRGARGPASFSCCWWLRFATAAAASVSGRASGIAAVGAPSPK